MGGISIIEIIANWLDLMDSFFVGTRWMVMRMIHNTFKKSTRTRKRKRNEFIFCGSFSWLERKAAVLYFIRFRNRLSLLTAGGNLANLTSAYDVILSKAQSGQFCCKSNMNY